MSVECGLAVSAIPVAFGDVVGEFGVAVDMAAVEVTAIANQQYMFVISPSAVVAHVVIGLLENCLSLSYLHHSCATILVYPYLTEPPSAAGALAGCTRPLLNALPAELVLTWQHALRLRKFS